MAQTQQEVFEHAAPPTRFQGIFARTIARPQKPLKPANNSPAPKNAHNQTQRGSA
jgi:hypothetical protein